MTPLRRLAVAVVGAALVIVPAGPVRAASPSALGYWWRLQSTSNPLPAPPFVPRGGLWVATDPSGQMAVSALRYRAPAGQQIARLVLHVAQNSGRSPVLLACPAKSSWTPVQAGAWAERPTPGCDAASVSGKQSSDATSWSFDVRGLARSGTLDIVILPPGDASTTYSVAFDPPSRTSIVTEPVPGSPTPTNSPPPNPSPSSSPTSRSGRPSPITTVLAEKTTAPVKPPTQLPSPSAAPTPQPGQTLVAFPPLELPPYRSPLLMAVALILPIAVLGGILRYRWFS